MEVEKGIRKLVRKRLEVLNHVRPLKNVVDRSDDRCNDNREGIPKIDRWDRKANASADWGEGCREGRVR